MTLLCAVGCRDDGDEDTGAGPGAALTCDSSGKNAFATYGLEGFVAITDSLFTNVMAELTAHGDDHLGETFTKIGSGQPASTTDDLATFKGKLAAFLVYAYGGPAEITSRDGVTYRGPQNMASAHAGLAITSAQYDYFVTTLVVPALTSNGVKHGAGGAADPNDVATCFAPVVTDAAFKATIVGK